MLMVSPVSQMPIKSQGQQYWNYQAQRAQVFAGKRVSSSLPVVDMLDLTSGDPVRRARFVKELGESLQKTGFVAIKNHGIDKRLLEAHYRAMKKLFALPHERLGAFDFFHSRGINRGYLPPNRTGPKPS